MIKITVEEEPEMADGVIKCNLDTALALMGNMKHLEKVSVENP